MSEIREYSYVDMVEKVLDPQRGPKTTIHGSIQLKEGPRLRIYRDMAHPETIVAESPDGDVIEYPWSLVVSARLKRAKVVALPQGQPQPQQGQQRR